MNIKRRLVSDEISQQLIKYQQQHNKTEELSAQVSDITIDSDHESTTPKLVTYMDQLANFIPPGVDLNEIIDEKFMNQQFLMKLFLIQYKFVQTCQHQKIGYFNWNWPIN